MHFCEALNLGLGWASAAECRHGVPLETPRSGLQMPDQAVRLVPHGSVYVTGSSLLLKEFFDLKLTD